MKYFKPSRRASKRSAASRRRRMKIETLEPRQMLAISDVIISEIMYHPNNATEDEIEVGFDDEDEFEYVELYNRGDTPVNMKNWSITRGFEFDFTDDLETTVIPAKTYRLIVRDENAFQFRYPDVTEEQILGEFTDGKLSDGGETIELKIGNTVIALIKYDDAGLWPARADGGGSSLQIEDVNELFKNPLDPLFEDRLYDVRNWTGSQEVGGSPGTAGVFTDFGVVINEVLANSDDNLREVDIRGEVDKIELYNTTETAIIVGGTAENPTDPWFLSDRNDVTPLYQIPNGTVIPAEGYVVFDEWDFNRTENAFVLSAREGENLSLMQLAPNGDKQFVDWVGFGPTETSVSSGRLPNGRGELFPLESQSFGIFDAEAQEWPGAENAQHRLIDADVVISEIMYHPAVIISVDDGLKLAEDENVNLEFIELHNRSDSEVDLNPSIAAGSDWYLKVGTRENDEDFDFFPPGTKLAPDERLIVLRFDPTAFAMRALKEEFEEHYGVKLNGTEAGNVNVKAVGGYGDYGRDDKLTLSEMRSGLGAKLSNSIESIELQQQVEVASNFKEFLPRDLVIYRDGGAWPNRPDGDGSSLERKDSDFYGNDPDSWRPSFDWNGSPGTAGQTNVDVIINEVLTHTDPPLIDTIEFYNAGEAPVNVSGWLLSDSGNNYFKYTLVTGAGRESLVLQPGEYLLFNENDFNSTRFELPIDQDPNDFALSSARGETLWLLETDVDGKPVRFADRARFGGALNDESFGRIPNGDPTVNLFPNMEVTLGAENSGPRVGPLVISEIMYNPTALTSDDEPFFGTLDGNDLEFIEIVNPTNNVVDLVEWRLEGGVTFSFATADIQVTDPMNPPFTCAVPHADGSPKLGPGETIVVLSFNPALPGTEAKEALFREFYGLSDDVALISGYSGSLSNEGERVRLESRDEQPAGECDFYPRILEDEVTYDDRTPWPTSPDGRGDSLHRADVELWGHDVNSWESGTPTPGTFDAPPTSPAPLVLEALSPTSVRLSWTDSVWEDEYRVSQWFGSWQPLKTLDADSTSVTLTGRQPGTTNRYKVEARNDHGSTSSEQEITMPATDLGDAPAPYPTLLSDDGAIHVAIGPTLGDLRDDEADGQPSTSADGDGADEDGVVFGTIQVGQFGASVQVTVQNAPAQVNLDAWIDFNGDGDWDDAGEQIKSGGVNLGSNRIEFDVPANAFVGDTYARFRLSTQGGLAPTGLAGDGEVEDYLVTISPGDDTLPADLTGNGAVDFEDLTVLLANWNQDVGAEKGNLVSPDSTPVNFEDLTVLLAAWTGPLAVGAPGAQAVDDSSSAVFDEIGEESSSEDLSQPSRRERRRAASRREGSQLRRLQAVAVDRAMTDREDAISPLRSRLARRRGR